MTYQKLSATHYRQWWWYCVQKIVRSPEYRSDCNSGLQLRQRHRVSPAEQEKIIHQWKSNITENNSHWQTNKTSIIFTKGANAGRGPTALGHLSSVSCKWQTTSIRKSTIESNFDDSAQKKKHEICALNRKVVKNIQEISRSDYDTCF